jgi:hypothetical protein
MVLSRPIWRCFVASLMLVSVPAFLIGCGGSKDTETAATSGVENGSDSGADSGDKPVKKRGSKSAQTKKTQVAAPDVKRIDGIPLDVFFDRPLTVAADKTTGAAPAASGGASTEVAKTDTPKMADSPKSDAPKAAAGGGAEGAGGGWDKVITAEELVDAVKGVRNQLQQRLANVQTYNSAQLEVPIFGTELVMLAEIARNHPGEIRWKDKAKFVRSLAIEIVKTSSSADARGKKSFDALTATFAKACELLDGNTPPDLPEAPDEVSLEENANIKYVMKRLDRVESVLKTGTATEDGFKKSQQVAIRESAMLAALARGIKDKSYGYDSEDDYNKQADGMFTAARGMVKAAQDGNFTEYDNLRNAVSTRCSDCHMTYRTGK